MTIADIKFLYNYTESANEQIFDAAGALTPEQTMRQVGGSFPVAAYPPWARLLFTFVLPVAFVTNVPAQAATGRLSLEWGLGALAFSAFALCGATLLWNLAIRNYSSASS